MLLAQTRQHFLHASGIHRIRDLAYVTLVCDTRDMRTGVQMKYGSDPFHQVNYSYDAVDQLVGETATGGVAVTSYSRVYS